MEKCCLLQGPLVEDQPVLNCPFGLSRLNRGDTDVKDELDDGETMVFQKEPVRLFMNFVPSDWILETLCAMAEQAAPERRDRADRFEGHKVVLL